MNFLNGALLPGLLFVAAVPLVIHLLNLRYPKKFEFSSVKHLRTTIAQRSRIFRWRHLILLALRTLMAAALLFAFLRPTLPRLGSNDAAKSARTVLLLIDQSLSMEHQVNGISGRERAQEEARRILATLGPDDVVNVVIVGTGPRAWRVDLARESGDARRFVEAMKPGLGRANFTQANTLSARLLAGVKQGGEIYYISDFQRKTWANVDFTPVSAAVRVFFVDVSTGPRMNRAILGVTVDQAQVLAGDTVTLDIEVGNYSDEAMREPVKVLLDAQVSFEKEVSIAPWSTGHVTLPVPPGGPGLHWCEVSLASDALPQDDRFVLTLPVLEKEGVLIVSDTPEPEKDTLLFLKTALNPYENQGGSLLPQHVRVAGMDGARLAAVRKVFVTRSGSLDEPRAKILADFLFNGGGIVWFLDGEHESANLSALERAMNAGPLPLKAGAKRVAKNVGQAAQQIARGDFRSKFLRLFRDAQRQNLALLEFYDIHEATATGTGRILLSYADETPAMAQLQHGLGTLLLMNFSAGELSSNLARQRIFPAWMQEIVKNLETEEPQPASSAIGETVTSEVWRHELTAHPLMKPSGREQEIKAEPLGERVAITFNPEETGIYTMRPDRPLHAFAVNPDPNESDLRAIDRNLLPQELGERGQKGFFVEQRDDYADLIRGRPIFHWFLIGGLIFLVIETLFQLYVRRAAARPA
jgi:hypothetical protein